MIASVKEIDALNITLFNSCINFTNVHVCNYCTKIFVIIVNTCVCRRSVDNKVLILSYPPHFYCFPSKRPKGDGGGGGKTIEMWRWWWWRENNRDEEVEVEEGNKKH